MKSLIERFEQRSIIRMLLFMRGGKQVNRTEYTGDNMDWVSQISWLRGLDRMEFMGLATNHRDGKEIKYILSEKGEKVADLLSLIEDALNE